MERGDIVAARCRFLCEIKGVDFDKIVWLDEMWVNAGQCHKLGWTDDSLKGNMAIPMGKDERFILTHPCTLHGFVPN